MLYVNFSKERQLVCTKRIKKWVDSGDTVDIDSADMKFLGPAASSLITKVEFDKKVAIKKSKRARRARRARKLARRAIASVTKKAPALEIKKVVEKKASKQKVAVVAKKVVAKNVPTAPTVDELKSQRSKIKDVLSKKNKNDILSIGRKTLGISLKTNDKKDSLINNILNFSKKYGYDKIIKKI